MFQIDRSYIDHVTLETLQGHIWDIRTDYKDDPTLPRLEHYNIASEEAFEQYLEQKQKFEDFKESWRKYRLLIFGLAFAIPVALFSLFVKIDNMAFYAYASAFLLCLLIYVVYTLIKAIRERKFRNNPCETFIKALLSWEQAQKG
ncbi:MAG: hypothetical protein IJ588_12035 [Prevotella sp.]|nr:hypothetical protein [Prevotella sp.]